MRNRRRNPGLRREEVAELANIGVSWYTLLEQGHDVHPSRHVLESLVQALRLSTAEEQHLFLLAVQERPSKMLEEEAQVTPALQRVVDAYVTFQTSITPNLRVKVFAASPSTASKLERVLSAPS